MRSSASLQTRLVLSHLLVSLISIISISVFAGSAILNAARNEVDHNLDTIALTASGSFEEPLLEFNYGGGTLLKVQQTLYQMIAAHPELHYTVYSIDGSPILDSTTNNPRVTDGENLEEIFQAIYSESGKGSTTHPNTQGDNSYYVARRIENNGEPLGVIRVGVPLQPALASTRPLLLILFLVSILVALAVSVFGWLLARNLTRPIQYLTNAANQLARGDLDARVSPVGPHELHNLGEVFNHMANRLQGYVGELRAFAANASHELRTPLTIIKLRVEALRSGAVNDPPVADRFLEEVESEIDRLSRMVSDLLDLSRMEAGLASRSRTWLDMGSIADDVCETFQIRAERAGINVELNKDPDLPSMMGNEDQLHRVLYNLFDNALRYTPKGGTVVVTLKARDSGKTIRLEVRDSGRGIPPEHLPRIFERFYRAEATRPHYGGEDKTSSGSGLGLAIAKSIVEYHGGKIGASSKLGEGSIFWAELPVSD